MTAPFFKDSATGRKKADMHSGMSASVSRLIQGIPQFQQAVGCVLQIAGHGQGGVILTQIVVKQLQHIVRNALDGGFRADNAAFYL